MPAVLNSGSAETPKPCVVSAGSMRMENWTVDLSRIIAAKAAAPTKDTSGAENVRGEKAEGSAEGSTKGGRGGEGGISMKGGGISIEGAGLNSSDGTDGNGLNVQSVHEFRQTPAGAPVGCCAISDRSTDLQWTRQLSPGARVRRKA